MGRGVDELARIFGKQQERQAGTALATVTRVDDDGAVWCAIEGGAGDFPCTRTTAEVAPGDSVTVTIADGRATIDGSISAPSISAARASELIAPVSEKASAAKDAADVAIVTAEASAQAAAAAAEAVEAATASNQHFWHTTDATAAGAAGAYVTDSEQTDWETEYAKAGHGELGTPTAAKPWYNMLWNSLGALLRTGLKNLVSITRSAIEFYDGSGNDAANVVASFGADGVQIGKPGKSHLELDYHSMQLVDKDGNAYFHASDLRDSSGYATITEKFNTSDYPSGTVSWQLNFRPRSDATTTYAVDGVDKGTVYGIYQDTATVSPAVGQGHTLEITYQTNSDHARAFTFGERLGGALGALSSSFGYNNTASGNYSHAEGERTKASGRYSHAEGSRTTASGDYSHAEGAGYFDTVASGSASHAEGAHSIASGDVSHAEGSSCMASGFASHAQNYNNSASGDYSHAEGEQSQAYGMASHAEGYNVVAGGNYSHAEGWYTKANGDQSHAQGLRTIADGENQTALGKHNVADSSNTYAVIIGNGTADNARSDAARVDWSGNVEIDGDVKDLSGNEKYLPLSGGTLTGPLDSKWSEIDRDGADLSSDVSRKVIGVIDNDGELVGAVYSVRRSSGRQDIGIYAYNENNGAQVNNALRVQVAKDGTKSYAVGDRSAFRYAVGIETTTTSVDVSVPASGQAIVSTGYRSGYICVGCSFEETSATNQVFIVGAPVTYGTSTTNSVRTRIYNMSNAANAIKGTMRWLWIKE